MAAKQLVGRPLVNRQSKGRFGDEEMAAQRLPAFTGRVVTQLVVTCYGFDRADTRA